MKKNVIQFEPSILTKRNLKEYKGYKHSIAFKINKLSSQLKRFTVRNFRKYGLGNPELILTVRGIGYASQRVGETATSLES